MRRWQALLQGSVWLIGMGALLVGCGQARATPTPLPADVVRPDQPTPVYADSAAFSEQVATPIFATPFFTTSTVISAAVDSVTPALERALLAQVPPTGLGIVQGGATLFTSPGGAALENLPNGTPLTLTGKSADGAWLAVYTNAGAAGWVNAGALVRYGDAQLLVVEQAFGPGPVATLIAEAMAPIAMPPIDLTPPATITTTLELNAVVTDTVDSP